MRGLQPTNLSLPLLVEQAVRAERIAMTGGAAKNIRVLKTTESLLWVALFIPEESTYRVDWELSYSPLSKC